MKKLLFILVLISLIGSFAYGQETYNYRLGFDLPVNTSLGQIEINDSCFYVLGRTVDTSATAKLSVLFAKISLQGEVLWNKILADTLSHYWLPGDNLTPTEDGNFLFTSRSSEPSISWITLLKYTPEGDTVFTKKYLPPFLPQEEHEIDCKDLAILEDGGLLILGRTYTPTNISDLYLIKTDSIGNVLWEQTYGYDLFDIGMHIQLTDDNRIIIIGEMSNWDSAWSDYIYQNYIFEINESGGIEWEYLTPEEELMFRPGDVISTSDGGLLISSSKGVEGAPIDMYSPNIVDWYANIYKLDADQNLEWETDVSGFFNGQESVINSLIEVSDNSGFIGAGHKVEYGDDMSKPNSIGIIAKISPTGDSLWTRSYRYLTDGWLRHSFAEVEELEDGFILIGEASLVNSFDSIDFPIQRGWIVKVDQYGCLVPGCHLMSDVSEPNSKPQIQVNVHPNPTSDYLNIYFRHPAMKNNAQFDLLDANGRSVLSFESRQADITHMAEVSGLATGVYFLTCRVGQEVITKEVVIAR